MTPDEFNASCIQELFKVNLRERVAVVGSGPSIPYICPSKELQDRLCVACEVTKQESEEFWDLAQRAYDRKPTEYYRIIHDCYSNTPHWQAKTYTHIASLPVLGFATLNYDDQLPSACRDIMKDAFMHGFTVYPPRPDQTYASPIDFRGPYKQIIALHGYSDPEHPDWEKNLIFKRSDYNQHYTEPPPYPLFDWWRTMLLVNPCIFMGTSLREPGLLRVFQHLQSKNPEKLAEMGHMHLVDCTPNSETGIYPESQRPFGVIKQIQYDPIDRRHTGLIKILGEFSGLPTGPPSPRAPGPALIGATDTLEFS